MPLESRAALAAAEKGDGTNVTIYLGAFMDLEAVVRRHPREEEENEEA